MLDNTPAPARPDNGREMSQGKFWGLTVAQPVSNKELARREVKFIALLSRAFGAQNRRITAGLE